MPGFGTSCMGEGAAIQSITLILAVAKILPPLFFLCSSFLLLVAEFKNEMHLFFLCLLDVGTKDEGIFFLV